MVKWIDVSVSQHRLKLFDGNRLIKTYPIAVGKHKTLIGRLRLSINNAIAVDHLECYRWGCQSLITAYTEPITHLPSARMSRMDVFECLIMMF